MPNARNNKSAHSPHGGGEPPLHQPSPDERSHARILVYGYLAENSTHFMTPAVGFAVQVGLMAFLACFIGYCGYLKVSPRIAWLISSLFGLCASLLIKLFGIHIS